jgi:hypothetical protein
MLNLWDFNVRAFDGFAGCMVRRRDDHNFVGFVRFSVRILGKQHIAIGSGIPQGNDGIAHGNLLSTNCKG